MSIRPESFDALVRALSRFPTIGSKTAARIAVWLISRPESVSEEIGRTIMEMRRKIRACSVCRQLTEDEICAVCRDESRDRTVICVLEDAVDVWNFERMKQYRGLYHVLGGSLSPIDGIGHDELSIDALLERVRTANPPVREIIFATDSDTEGNATAHYISELLAKYDITKTRLAHGIPIGGEVGYLDDATLAAAITNRSSL